MKKEEEEEVGEQEVEEAELLARTELKRPGPAQIWRQTGGSSRYPPSLAVASRGQCLRTVA